MDKLASATYPINELIARRWSPRAFDPKRRVDRTTLGTLFEAARWAPSAGNIQPWRFIVGVNFDKTHQGIFETLADGNKRWCKNVPVLLIAVVALNFPDEDKPNRHALHDLGLALENMFLQAVDLGLSCHLMAGFDPEKVRQSFSIPEGYQPMTAGAVGYPGNINDLSESLRQRELQPRERRPLKETVFTGSWESPLDI